MTNKEFAQGLRELAEIYEKDERMPRLDNNKFRVYVSFAHEFREGVKALATLGGRVEKLAPESGDDFWYRVQCTLPSGLKVELQTPRSSICKRVTKLMPVETWECDPLLEDSTKEGQ